MTIVYIYFVVFAPGLFCLIPCDPGFYGEHCDKHCSTNCRSHVNDQTYCDKDTGECSSGCISGRWGSQCSHLCSKNCMDHVCFHQTGRCSKGCTETYRGHLCEEYIEANPKTSTKDPPGNDPPEETHLDNINIDIMIFGGSSIVFIIAVVALYVVIKRRTYLPVTLIRSNNASGMQTDLHDATYSV